MKFWSSYQVPASASSCPGRGNASVKHGNRQLNYGLPVLLIAAMAIAATPAKADSFYGVTFTGNTVSGDPHSGTLSGSLVLQVSSTQVPGVPGGYQVTGISGTFTDTSIGLVNAAVTGLAPVSGLPTVGADGTFHPTGTDASIPFTYDDIFYPAGHSPVICPPDVPGGPPGYPFSGGVTDIYGVAFYVNGGTYSVDLWSDGVFPGAAGPLYEVDDATGGTAIHPDVMGDAVPASVSTTPEPGSFVLLGTGLLGFAGAMRRRLFS